jgi:carbon-monoxide dehydrogenase medium subunit
VDAAELFVAPLESCLHAGELAVSAHFPRPPARTGTAWREVARRNGDYALCGVGALVTLDGSERIASARCGYISVGPTPLVLDLTESVVGLPADSTDSADWASAGRQAAAAVEPEDDVHASAEYRRHLTAVLTERTLRAAAERAVGRP